MEQKNNWELVESHTIENSRSRSNFWKAILLSVTKPHLINRRLAGAEQISVYRRNLNDSNIESSSSAERFIDQVVGIAQKTFHEDSYENILPKVLDETQTLVEFHEVDIQCTFECDLNREKCVFVILSKLLPKNLASNKITYEIAIIDTVKNEVAFLSLLKNQTTGFIKRFKIILNDRNDGEGYTELLVKVLNDDATNFSRQSTWIKSIFIPKILKWLVSINDDDEVIKSQSDFNSIDSLSLINISEYNQLYHELKVKYGEHMVKIWPEQTDAAKFVHEDVAIATYLILLWREERHRLHTDRLQSFVDLGCGNGLLVYILSSEGHTGYGIDIRKRGIWDLYPSTTVLKLHAFIPSDRSLFSDIDWIIGNHSDELSPWIPIISARSSYHSRYFLLPCCAFEFNGQKFRRRCSAVSQYMDFLSFAKQISDVCGFRTRIDRLKIPSTKRICLVGYERTYSFDEQHERENQIQEFIDANSVNITAAAAPAGAEADAATANHSNNNNWNNDFQPRSDTEKVQNCTQINKDIQNDIVEQVFTHLLMKKRYSTDSQQLNWNLGGKVSLNDLASQLPRDKLKALKSECGGLQTLLKNHSQIFRISKGTVEIKMPIKWSERKRQLEAKGIKIQIKHKKCWFYEKHPDGCPLEDMECSYVH